MTPSEKGRVETESASTRVPRTASDTFRGYISLAAALPISFLTPFVIVFTSGLRTQTVLVVATLFISWTLASALTTLLTLRVFLRADHDQLRAWLIATTPMTQRARLGQFINGGGATGWAITGSLLAVIAVAVMILRGETVQYPVVAIPGILVVVSSLGLTISSYAVRYAREHVTNGGFTFAGDREPRFADFLYLAVQVATTFGTSDVTVTTTRARTLVSVNSILAFTFNTVVVAMLVSVLISRAG